MLEAGLRGAAGRGGEGMTGNRTRLCLMSKTDNGETRHSQPNRPLVPGAPMMRRTGAGLKAKPAARVDLRSSLDPGPSTTYVRTEPEKRRKRSQLARPQGMTRPRSFRDDTEGSLLKRTRDPLS